MVPAWQNDPGAGVSGVTTMFSGVPTGMLAELLGAIGFLTTACGECMRAKLIHLFHNTKTSNTI
jgi:hypothetical protein